jgi:hypothetical protein
VLCPFENEVVKLTGTPLFIETFVATEDSSSGDVNEILISGSKFTL